MKKIVIVGGGGFAREILWLVEDINKASKGMEMPYEVVGFVTAEGEGHVDGLPILGDDAWAFANLDKATRVVIAIGDTLLRAAVAQRYVQQGFQPLRLVHPSVVMSDQVQLGAGSLICAGAVLTVNVQVGAFSIVNLNATAGHDCVIGDFVTIHPGVHLSGNVQVGDLSELGTGAVVLPGRKVGEQSVVGAGAVVAEDLEGGATYVGIPARQV